MACEAELQIPTFKKDDQVNFNNRGTFENNITTITAVISDFLFFLVQLLIHKTSINLLLPLTQQNFGESK